jgi:hypothetical protein
MVNSGRLDVSHRLSLFDWYLAGGIDLLQITKGRARRPDPLASAPAVGLVLDSLRSSLPDFIPRLRKNLVALPDSVRGIYARPATDTRWGRPSRFDCQDLLRVDARLRDLLARETLLGPGEVTDDD